VSKEPNILPEDHEQYERDYYDRESGDAVKGCMYALKIWAVAIILLTLAMLFFSCGPTERIASRSTGTVIEVDGYRVLVAFPVAYRNVGDQTVNWFYIPGHSYVVRDRYPDPSKDPSMRP
jgi:hypothetical protein